MTRYFTIGVCLFAAGVTFWLSGWFLAAMICFGVASAALWVSLLKREPEAHE